VVHTLAYRAETGAKSVAVWLVFEEMGTLCAVGGLEILASSIACSSYRVVTCHVPPGKVRAWCCDGTLCFLDAVPTSTSA
jgi:hypothetical protein